MSELRQPDRRENVRLLEERCGVGASLVIDTLLTVLEAVDFLPAAQVADLVKASARNTVKWLPDEPLLLALQGCRTAMADVIPSAAAAAADNCWICSPPLLLSTAGLSLSGSMAEGFHDLEFDTGGTSDYDTMLQLDGAFRWTAEAVVEEGAEPGLISPESAPQLWAEPTGSPGFVMLRWARTFRCAHDTPRPALTPDSVRQLMRDYVQVCATPEEDISCSGPAVNVAMEKEANGGMDHVPCLRLRWWPDKRGFLSRRRMTDFPPAAVRRNICEFGVHLVPTGRPGSATELSEWRLSFSRAETVAAHQLSITQRATVKAVKRLKNSLKESGAAPALKSYFIKTAVLWLIQDEPEEVWSSLMDAVHMVLDWLERHLIAGRLPCFFWAEIDILSGISKEKVEDMIRTVRLMKSQATRLLLAWCESKVPDLVQSVLEQGGSEPLPERQLRLCLARLLIRQAVVLGIVFRPTAPCWYFWSFCFIPTLVRISESRLLEWRYHRDSGAYHQQIYLFEALSVAPADLLGGVRMTSSNGDMFTWDVTPIMAMLTYTDLRSLLGDPDAVAVWCRRQLCRPLAERPTGLTAELETPRGRADLLLRPELLLRALREAVPAWSDVYQRYDEGLIKLWRQEFKPSCTYQGCRAAVEKVLNIHSIILEMQLHLRLGEKESARPVGTAHLWWWYMQYLLSGDRLRSKYDAASTGHSDVWQLRQFVVLDDPNEGSPQADERGASGGKQQQQQQRQDDRYHSWAVQQCCSYLDERQKLETLLYLQQESQARQHRQEREEQLRQHRQEEQVQQVRRYRQAKQMQQHHQKEQGRPGQRYRQEQAELQWRHRQEQLELKRRHRQEWLGLVRRQRQAMNELEWRHRPAKSWRSWN